MNSGFRGMTESALSAILTVTTPATPLLVSARKAHPGGLLFFGGLVVKYDKPPLSIDEQIALLISRGMAVPDTARASRYLSHLNYYRLRAYWMPFEEQTGNGEHHFRPGTTFDDALTLYVFDRKFRLLVLEAIERVEVSFRTQFAYVLAMKYGSHAYLDANLFEVSDMYEKCLASFQEELNRSRETFIGHYKNKYDDPAQPPIWAACEIISLGQLSKWFGNIKNRPDRKAIAEIYGLDEKVLGSFMHHITHVRNLAAHHSRLWNRRMTFTMALPRTPLAIVSWFNAREDRNIYNTLVMLAYMLNKMSPGTTWVQRLRQLIEETLLVNPLVMGFPENWRDFSLWSNRL
jgi:abortive infection bacteriophage resistance protein